MINPFIPEHAYRRSLSSRLGEFCMWLAGWCAIIAGLITTGLLLGQCAGSAAFAADEYRMEEYRPQSTVDSQCMSTTDLQEFLRLTELEGSAGGVIIAVRSNTGVVLWVYNTDTNEWCVASGEPA